MNEFRLPARQAVSLPLIAGQMYEEILKGTGVRLAFWDATGKVIRTQDSAADGDIEGLGDLVHQAIERGEAMWKTEQGSTWFAIPLKRRNSVVAAATGHLPFGRGKDAEEPSAGDGQSAEPALALMQLALTAQFDRIGMKADIEDLSHNMAESYEEISLLYRLSHSILANQPPEEFFLHACSELLEVLNVDGVAAILLPGELSTEPPQIISAGTLPLDPEEIPELCLSFIAMNEHPENPIIKNDCQKDPSIARLSTAIRSFLMVPLHQEHRGYSIIAAFNKISGEADGARKNGEYGEFDSTDVKLIASVAGTSAIFVDNHHLYHDLKDLMIGVIKALVSAIDAKDPYTCGHSERVAITAKRIAEKIGLAPEAIENIYMAGLLHDIGKIGVPERILLKKGKLEPEEHKIMNGHPAIGSKILSGIKRLESVIPGVRYHHERLDGGGYPEGLNEDNMPLMGRIIGLADAFDAMTSNRPYRPTMLWDTVLAEIRRCTGTQFDVKVVDAFFSLDLKELVQEFMNRPTIYAGNLAPV